MQRNNQLELAYNFVQYTDRNIFLTGKAGTGKTTFLHNLKKTSLKRMAIVAPTGVAAINAGGVTIHSFFQMPFGPYISQSLSPDAGPAFMSKQRHMKFHKEKINILKSLDLLVIDEISMVRADLLDGIDEVLRRYRDHSKPFGGVQLLMIGDLHQLSPVVKDEDWKILQPYYSNLYFFSSHALQKTAHVSIELKHIYRQSDTHFINLLNCIRENRIDHDVLTRLNSRYLPDFKAQDEEGYITLTTHNNTAREINEVRLTEIPKTSHRFRATVINDFPEYSYPTGLDLELKIGAQVMFVKNDSSRERLFYNGKIGKISRFDDETIYVKCPGESWEIAVTPAEWQNISYELNNETKEIEEKVVGSFSQYPLKLAWAITIHKSQGLTFEKAIIDAQSSFAHGQVYVALSRCKTFEGMVLRSPIAFNSVRTDGTVSAYTRQADENAPGEQDLLTSKATFQKSLLRELFDFGAIKTRFFHLKKAVEDNDSSLSPALNLELNEIKINAEAAVYSVAEKFTRQLHHLFTEGGLPEEDEGLQERIKKGSDYFIEKTEHILFSPASRLVIESDNKNVLKVLSEALANLKKELFIKLSVMKAASAGFNTMTYLKTKANAEIDFTTAESTKPAARTAVPKDTAHPDLYNKLRSWRNELASENNVPAYIVLPQKALAELVSKLPSGFAELETVKGIGKQKVQQYGKAILTIIAEYCEENNIQQTPLNLSLKEEKSKPDTKKISFDLYKEGKSTDEIALERGLTQSTIEGHLAHFIGTGEIDVYNIVAKEKVGIITEFFQEKRPASLTEAKHALGDDISYSELRAVMKHLQFNSEFQDIV